VLRRAFLGRWLRCDAADRRPGSPAVAVSASRPTLGADPTSCAHRHRSVTRIVSEPQLGERRQSSDDHGRVSRYGCIDLRRAELVGQQMYEGGALALRDCDSQFDIESDLVLVVFVVEHTECS
jgi:hypothetical protein